MAVQSEAGMNGMETFLNTSEEEEEHLASFQEDLVALLSSYHFADLKVLRHLMRRTSAVISGSATLALIHPHRFVPNDIDFYVLPRGFPAVLKYVESHGYNIKPFDLTTLDYFHQNIVVVRLVHPISQKSINVTTAVENHIVTLITHFHSTLVMNYLAWFGLVVLYPEWTLRKTGLVIADNTPITRTCVGKYSDRGYTLHRDVFQLTQPLQQHTCQNDPYCPTTTRSLHDGHCLVKPFQPYEFNFKTVERNCSWLLPVSCSFQNLDAADENLDKVL